jgi:uncharacterized membrane protein
MKIKILIGVLVFLILVNLATIGTFLWVLARGRPPGDVRGPWPGRQRMNAPFAEGRRMGHLPPEQREQLEALLQGLREETVDMRKQIHDLEAQTFSLMKRDPVPVERVDSLLEELSDARLAMSKITARKLIEARSFLSPEEQGIFFNALMEPRQGMLEGTPHRGRDHDGRMRMMRGRPHGERSPDSLP